MDFISRVDVIFLPWAKRLTKYVSDNAARFGCTAETLSPLQALLVTYQEKMAVIDGGNAGPVDRAGKQKAKTELTQEVRNFVQRHIRRNPAVTDEDLKAMEIPAIKTTKSRVKKPKNRPLFDVAHEQYGEVVVTTNAKPAGVHHVEIWWVNAKDWDISVKDYTKMGNHIESTIDRTVLKLPQGETFLIVCRWSVEASETSKGPWSAPKKELIS